MRASLMRYVAKVDFRSSIKVLLASVLLCTSELYAVEQLSLQPLPPGQIEWVYGPAQVNLGKEAVMDLPQGYGFMDARTSAMILRKMRNPVPKGLLGIVAPESGKSWIVFEFVDVGFVRDVREGSKVDAEAALALLRKHTQSQNPMRLSKGLQPIASLDWATEPVFDAKANSLEWAVRAGTGQQPVINRSVRLLGRRGVLDATAVHAEGGDAIPLKELMKSVSFKPGSRYTDYVRGDKIAEMGLEGLIAQELETASGSFTRTAIWVGAVVAVCLVTVGVVLIRRKMRHGSRTWREMSRSLADASGLNGARPKTVPSGNGGANGAARRKRVFNYHKYYADLMLQVSSHPQVYQGGANGNSPREDNGSPQLSPHDLSVNQIVRANLELIANQTNLIEEQKRLLHEQSKLIEEKTKLIKEKNELLQNQAELFQRDLM